MTLQTAPDWVLPLLTGGGLILAGTVMSQLMGLWTGWIQRRHEWRKVRREKFEELADCVSKTIPWFQRLASCRTISDVSACHPPIESRRMTSLALLYFPELKDPAAAYHNGLILYFHFVLDCSDSAGVRYALHPEIGKRTNELHAMRQSLDNAIEKSARKYTLF